MFTNDFYRKCFIAFIIIIGFGGCYYEDIPRDGSSNPDLCVGSTLNLAAGLLQATSGCGKSDGSLTVIASGGNPPYSYSLNGNVKQNSGTFNNLAGGTYSVTVFDAIQCSFVLNNLVIGNPGNTLSLNATTKSNNSCLTPNGEVQLVATGGTPPYKFSFNNAALSTTATYTGLAQGTYTASVVDNNGSGCQTAISVTISQSNTTDISYVNVIKPLITNKCASATCHGAGNKKPGGDLTTYDLAKESAAEIKSRTASGNMPKTGSLTAEQIKQIACWVDAGAPNN